jgi:hypothetical protein
LEHEGVLVLADAKLAALLLMGEPEYRGSDVISEERCELLLEVDLGGAEHRADHRLVLHFAQHLDHLLHLLVLISVRLKKRRSVRCGQCDDHALRGHRLAALVAERISAFVKLNIGDAGVGPDRDPLRHRFCELPHSPIDVLPVRDIDLLGISRMPSIEAKHLPRIGS